MPTSYNIGRRIVSHMHYIQFTYLILIAYFIVNAIEYSKDDETYKENKTLFILNIVLAVITSFAFFFTFTATIFQNNIPINDKKLDGSNP